MRKLLSSFLFFTLLSTSIFANSDGTSPITAGEMVVKQTGISTDTTGLATGIYFIYSAVKKFKAGKNVVSGSTSAASGISSALGAVTIFSTAKASERVDIKDELKGSREYAEIAERLGEDLADEFILDVLAGWSLAKLHEKYQLSEDETTISEGSRGSDSKAVIMTSHQREDFQHSSATTRK